MAHGDFVWCDLSTFHVAGTRAFYGSLFGWRYETTNQPDGTPYHIASTGGREAAAVFEMPERFQVMGLPSFWMSYIAVDDIDAAVDTARTLGGKVEVEPMAFGDAEQIALVRDPLGAGFTLYQGSGLTPRPAKAAPGQMAWNALYVSDLLAVRTFYEALFGWQIADDPAQPGTATVRNASGTDISAIHEVDDALRGKDQFWGVHFAVADTDAAKADITAAGGQVIYEDADGPTILARDADGAAFFIQPAEHTPVDATRPPGGPKWRTGLALTVLWIAVLFEWNWVWGVLFLMWTLPALRTGQTYLVEPIARATSPRLFWAIVGSWIVLSLLLIALDVHRALGGPEPRRPGGRASTHWPPALDEATAAWTAAIDRKPSMALG